MSLKAFSKRIARIFTDGTPPPPTPAERLELILSSYREELKNEIDRGNALCEIIYKLTVYADGIDGLTPGETDRVKRIIANINCRNLYLDNHAKKREFDARVKPFVAVQEITVANMRNHDLWIDFASDVAPMPQSETMDDQWWLEEFIEWLEK